MAVMLTLADMNRIRNTIAQHGERAMLEASGVNATSLARAALGLRVHRGTVALILSGLERLESRIGTPLAGAVLP